MSEQHYVIVGRDEIKQEGDLVWDSSIQEWRTTDLADTHGHRFSAYLRPANPQPVNPWINDRKPEGSDAWRNLVEIWRNGFPYRIHHKDVKHGETWRPIDQTPPPAGPTEAELIEELLTIIESEDCGLRTREKTKQIRAKQESEGRDAR